MNRKAERARLDALKRDGDARCMKAKQELEAARKAFEAWEAPRVAYLAAIKRLEHETAALEMKISAGELALMEDARRFTAESRSKLNELIQDERSYVDRENITEKGKRLAALRQAVADIDVLNISGNDNVSASVNQIMASVPGWSSNILADKAPLKLEEAHVRVG